MAMKHYRGVDGVAREVKKRYRGVDGIARTVMKAYRGVDGIARQYFESFGVDVTFGTANINNRNTIYSNTAGYSDEGIYLECYAYIPSSTDTERVHAFCDIRGDDMSGKTFEMVYKDNPYDGDKLDFAVQFWAADGSLAGSKMITTRNGTYTITLPSGTNFIRVELAIGQAGTHNCKVTITSMSIDETVIV